MLGFHWEEPTGESAMKERYDLPLVFILWLLS